MAQRCPFLANFCAITSRYDYQTVVIKLVVTSGSSIACTSPKAQEHPNDRGAFLLGDLWHFSLALNSWTQLLPSGEKAPARNHHSAVFDATSVSMLIYGGWGGSTYLADLWLYSLEAEIWTQLLPGNAGPDPRRGHSAVWDSVSMSILIYGGVANSTETYYADDLWNYSKLSNSWMKMAPSSISGRPSGRRDHVAAPL